MATFLPLSFFFWWYKRVAEVLGTQDSVGLLVDDEQVLVLGTHGDDGALERDDLHGDAVACVQAQEAAVGGRGHKAALVAAHGDHLDLLALGEEHLPRVVGGPVRQVAAEEHAGIVARVLQSRRARRAGQHKGRVAQRTQRKAVVVRHADGLVLLHVVELDVHPRHKVFLARRDNAHPVPALIVIAK